MSEADDDVIARYAGRILALKAARDAVVDDALLGEIARELGMGDADLQAVKDAAAAHVVRARGYADHGRVDDAVAELEVARGLAPRDHGVLFALAEALAARFGADRNKDGADIDAERARELVRACLAMVPDHAPSFALLNALDGTPPRRSVITGVAAGVGAVVGAGALAGVVVAVGVGVFFGAFSSGTSSGASSGGGASPGIAAPVERPGPAEPTNPTGPTGDVDLPVTVVDDVHSAGLRVDVRHAVLARYPGSAFFQLHALVHNDRPALVSQIDWRLELVDSAGVVVTAVTDEAPSSYEADLRPGDAFPLSHLIPTDARAAALRLTVVRVVEEPLAPSGGKAATFPPSPPTTLSWDVPKPSGVDVIVRERARAISPSSFGLGPYLQGTWEFENTGTTPLRLLKVEVRAFDDAGAALPFTGPFGNAQYVTAPSYAAVRPGEVRLLDVTKEVPAKTARTELWVIEAK